MSKPDKPLGERNFEQFARRYAAAIETKPHNAYLDRPAVLSLLPAVVGKCVLDAGCGPGIYTQWLADRGAHVVAVDVTPQFVQITRERVGDRAEVLVANLEEPLGFAHDDSFDLIVSALVLDHIREWGSVFAEFHRVLKPSGVLVYSCGHPMGDWHYAQRLEQGQRYFDIERLVAVWKGFGEPYPAIESFRRPLATMINPLIQAGFVLDHILEPLPTGDFQAADPEDYARLMREPAFLCVRAIKPAPRHL